jgi:hypothetical protein
MAGKHDLSHSFMRLEVENIVAYVVIWFLLSNKAKVKNVIVQVVYRYLCADITV